MGLLPAKFPWGDADKVIPHDLDVYEVFTEKHNGILVNQDTARIFLSRAARKYAERFDGYLFFKYNRGAPVALRELLDQGLYHIPDSYTPKEINDAVNEILQLSFPEYWKEREKRLAKQKGIETKHKGESPSR